ncbi:hypothetical protein VTI74DRAFT_5881 [Chaetomium olivicolor]
MPADDSEVHDGQGHGAKAYAEVLAEVRQPSLADLRRWIEASAETLAPSQTAIPYAPNAPSPGIPLPPEVVESLRVSISCFPETMLLTSSLSIETIRTYSKKVKHRADLHRHFQSSTDRSSIYSSGSLSARSSKLWNINLLGHARRRSKQHHLQHPHSLPPTDPQPVLDTSSSLHFTSTRPTQSQAPLWAPIQNIFPSASPHLCDALYAHLLAYNYISLLLPPPVPASHSHPSFYFPLPSRAASASAAQQCPSTSLQKDTTIPQKAAALLGMDDPVSATAIYRRPQTKGGHYGKLSRAKGRVLLSRRSASSGSRQLHELFFPSDGGDGGGPASHRGRETQEALVGVMSEVHAGLGRCVGLLVATVNGIEQSGSGLGGGGGGEGGDGLSFMVREELLKGEGGVGRVDPVLVRALCEVVRCAEEG